jgi:molybdopterin-guanine dinucleotide biosynthesis protein A
MKFGAVVLCGGTSSRMGAPKAGLPVGAELMLPRIVRIVREVVDSVVVAAAPGQDVPPLPDEVRIVRDEREGQGPIGGLAAGLAALEGTADAVYLSSCDVPLLKPEFVRAVARLLKTPPPDPLPQGERGRKTSPLSPPLPGRGGRGVRATLLPSSLFRAPAGAFTHWRRRIASGCCRTCEPRLRRVGCA